MVSGKDCCVGVRNGVAVLVSQGQASSVEPWSVSEGFGSRGLLCRGHVRCSKEWIGSYGESRIVPLWLSWSSLGLEWSVMAVVSS